MQKRTALLALSAIVGALLVACDPGYDELVINKSDQSFVLRYEPPTPGDLSYYFDIPAKSTGFTLGGSGTGWRGSVVVMTSECRPLGSAKIDADNTLLVLSENGTFSYTTEHIFERTDINLDNHYEQTALCLP